MISLTGCAARKEVRKEKRQVEESGVRIIEMPGDSVVYRPKVVYRDTTIVVRRKNVVLETTFSKGKVEKIKCKQDSVRIVENYTRQTDEQIKERKAERSGFQWKDRYILYVFLGLAGLSIINKVTEKIL